MQRRIEFSRLPFLRFAIHIKKAGVAVVCVLFLCSWEATIGAEERALTFVLMAKPDREALVGIRQDIEKVGGHALHVFPPDAMIASVSERAMSFLRNDPRVAEVSKYPVSLLHRTRTQIIAAHAWEQVLQNRKVIAKKQPSSPNLLLQESDQMREWMSAPPDALVPPREAHKALRSGKQTLASAVPYGADFYDTSEFFFGSVAVGVLILESSGSAYDWSPSEITQTLDGVVAGMDWWVAREPRANLTFVYDIHVQVPITAEPIQGSIGGDITWGAEALASLGYSSPDGVFFNARSYINDIRNANQTNWATMMFIVDSDPAVSQGLFVGGGYAHSYYGGPWLTMARYSTWAFNSAEYFTCVPAHEISHNFYTTDEYNSTKQYGGYFNGGDNDGESCIMNRNSLSDACDSTRIQLGWRFTGDQPDILNVPPVITLNPYIPNPTSNHTLTYTGTAVVGILENQNSVGQRHGITLNTITGAEYTMDLSHWYSATPVDATWDGGGEEFSFTSSLLSAGAYTFTVRGFDNRLDSSGLVSDAITVKLSPVVVDNNWNLISNPFVVPNDSANVLFPTASSRAFTFDGRYIDHDAIKNGSGYWLQFPSPDSIAIAGTELLEDTIDVHENWNMIGSLAVPIPESGLVPIVPLTIQSPVYGFSIDDGYVPALTIEPCKGYWVRVSGTGKVILRIPAATTSLSTSSLVVGVPDIGNRDAARGTGALSRLVFTDARGKTRTLFFTTHEDILHPENHELPPQPPDGTYDVRYYSQRDAEIVSGRNGRSQELSVIVQSARYPLQISWQVVPGDRGAILDLAGRNASEVKLVGSGTTTLRESEANRIFLHLEDQSQAVIPHKFALYSAYPNPFNPSTEIKYEIPAEAKVKIIISDLLGGEIALLADNIEEAGIHRVLWNGKTAMGVEAASGMYLYSIIVVPTESGKTGTLTETKKILLLR